MRNYKTWIVTVSIAMLALACSEESPFLSKEEALRQIGEINTSRDPFHYIENVAAIIDNDVYYFERLDSIPRRLTNTPGQAKTHVKLSWDQTRIAYLDASGSPVIISVSNGAQIKTLSQYSFISQMDWAKDRNTLYFLIDNEVHSDGEQISFSQPETMYPYPYDEVLSFSMNAIGDYGYFIKNYNSFNPVLQYRSDSKNLTKEFQSFDGDRYDYIDFYDNKGGFLLGYTDSYDDGIEKVVCIQDYKFHAAYEWDYETMNTPVFNADLEILLYGTVEDEQYQIKAVYLGTEAYEGHGIYDKLSKVFEEYTSDTRIYLDWVH